jgi:hypothetical protein
MGILKVATQPEVLRCKISTGRIKETMANAHRAKQIQQAYAACPNTKLIVSGYSQGGQIVHNAAAQLPANVGQWISSAVIFGDPGMSKCIRWKGVLRLTGQMTDPLLPTSLPLGLMSIAMTAITSA